MSALHLHDYFRSSASFRVRIALNLKGLNYSHQSHHLRKGEQRQSSYLAKNPQGLVPALELGSDAILTQSLAIIEYLEEAYPRPALLPDDLVGRAHVRSLALVVSSDIHPLGNLRVLNYLKSEYGADDDKAALWFRHWAVLGLSAFEQKLSSNPWTGDFCYGHSPSIADICLVPQIVNGARFGIDMTSYKRINSVFEKCMSLPAFIQAHPQNHPDKE